MVEAVVIWMERAVASLVAKAIEALAGVVGVIMS